MIPWLDFRIFGNGYGLAQPHYDGPFYWLSGRFYHWIGGLGAQLESFEWRAPLPGAEREIAGRTFRVLNTSRRGPRVIVSWGMVDLPRDIDAANTEIRFLRQIIGRLMATSEYASEWQRLREPRVGAGIACAMVGKGGERNER